MSIVALLTMFMWGRAGGSCVTYLRNPFLQRDSPVQDASVHGSGDGSFFIISFRVRPQSYNSHKQVNNDTRHINAGVIRSCTRSDATPCRGYRLRAEVLLGATESIHLTVCYRGNHPGCRCRGRFVICPSMYDDSPVRSIESHFQGWVVVHSHDRTRYSSQFTG